jgi:hypothetical protein
MEALGQPVTRQTSLDRLNVLLASPDVASLDKHQAEDDIKEWLRSARKIRAVKLALRSIIQPAGAVLSSIHAIAAENESFEVVSSKLQSVSFTEHLSKVLLALPKDPNTKMKQSATVRFVITAVMISSYPIKILVTPDESPDASTEAQECTKAARLLRARLVRLLTLAGRHECDLHTFRY